MLETPAPPRLVRVRTGRVIGGVAAGLAAHLGLPPLWLRVAFAVLTVGGGSGVVLYAAFWLVLPLAGPDEATDDVRSERAAGQAVALGALAAGALLLTTQLAVPGHLLLPLAAVLGGAALVWRQADETSWARRAARAGARPVLVSAAGAVLVIGGLAAFVAVRGQLEEARAGLLPTAVALTGIGLLAAPWLTRTVQELRTERHERIRSQERAELAAHVHDSVMQTLALIQANAGNAREVARLARSQERELRTWLYRPAGDPGHSLRAALEQAAAEVEQDHGVPVEVVLVGDAPVRGAVGAVVAAAREAVVNAAKHSGAPVVQVYAEVEEETVTVFVRDRGSGFEPAAVAGDRYGVAHSVVGRVERAGGTAELRTSPGAGTEVRLAVPRG